jgi:hypothetical protein
VDVVAREREKEGAARAGAAGPLVVGFETGLLLVCFVDFLKLETTQRHAQTVAGSLVWRAELLVFMHNCIVAMIAMLGVWKPLKVFE